MEKIEIFNGITVEEISRMLACFSAHIEEYAQGALVLDYSTNLQHVCVVLQGEIDVCCADANGNESIVETANANEVFGEIFSLPMDTVAYTAVAKTRCKVLFIDYGHCIHPCEKICPHHTQLINNLFVLSARKAQALAKHISILSQRTLRQKLTLYLEYLSTESESNEVLLPMSLSNLAKYLSVDRSAMMRELQRMRSEGLVQSEGRKFILPKRE